MVVEKKTKRKRKKIKLCIHVAVDFVSPESLYDGEELERRCSLPSSDDFMEEHKLQERINIHTFFEGYSTGVFDRQGHPKVLKLEWPSSDLFHEQLPCHYAELIRCLPFKHYTHPSYGCLNIPAKLPRMPVLNLGPNTCVVYGPSHSVDQWGSITKLQYAVSDRMVHPVYEQTVYLTAEHKRKLKDEYGDAVFVPAGCLCQMRNLKSVFCSRDCKTLKKWRLFVKQFVKKILYG